MARRAHPPSNVAGSRRLHQRLATVPFGVIALSLRAIPIGLALAGIAAAQNTPSPSSQMIYAIPAGPLGGALSEFAIQAHVTVQVDSRLVAGLNAQGLHGAYTIANGFAALLEGKNLEIAQSGPGVFLVRSRPAPSAAVGDTLLPAITVKSAASPAADGYGATQASGASKTDTLLIETPASISVVTHEQMVDQNAQTISQALRYTPGVVADQRGINEDSLEYLYSRGFQAETYLDGLRLPSPGQAGFNIATRDAYLLDHIESIRGPASVLYGQSPPGGIINAVSKLPTTTPLHELFVEGGSHGRLRSGFDFGGPANADGSLAYRLTGVGLTTGTQTHGVRQEKIAVAPSITWTPDARTSLTLTASYQKDPNAGAFNYVPAVGTVLPGKVHIPRSFNTGDPGFDRYTKEEASIGYAFEHRFNDVLEVKQNFRYLHNKQTIHHVGDGSNYDATGTALERVAYNNFGTFNSVAIDNQAIATFDTGPLKHKVLVGFDFQNNQYDHHLYYGSKDDSNAPDLSIRNPMYHQAIPTPDFLLGTSIEQRIRQAGLYAQDQISIQKLTLVGGLRQDWADMHTVSYKTRDANDQTDHALTGHAGVIYNFDTGLAPYVSYSTSFQPQSGSTDTGKSLKPSKGEQYEVGIKYQPAQTRSFFTAAVFDLRQTNLTVANSLFPGSVTQTGEVRSRGLELEGHAFLTDSLQLIASYTYDDVKNTRATADILDKAPAGIPKNMASLWLSYDLPGDIAPGLKLGAGGRFIASSYGDPKNTFRVPAHTLADLSVQYDLGRTMPQFKGVALSLNVSNLFDKTYVTCTDLTYCTYGQGRLVLAGMKYQW
jgi:iron complex outermembrane receptor protein